MRVSLVVNMANAVAFMSTGLMAMLGLTRSSLVMPGTKTCLVMVSLAHLFNTCCASSCRAFYLIGCKPLHSSALNCSATPSTCRSNTLHAKRSITLNAVHCMSVYQVRCILMQMCLLYCVHPLHTCFLPYVLTAPPV